VHGMSLLGAYGNLSKHLKSQVCTSYVQNMAVAERREEEPTTGRSMKSDLLFDKPGSNSWLTFAARNLAIQSPCLSAVKQSHCNQQ